MNTAVVILNWNGVDFLREFLPTVVDKSQAEADIYVVDNASSDDSIDLLEEQFPNVNIIRFEKNHGFTGGYNRALNQIDATYFVLLNSDVEVTNGWLSPIISMMEKDQSIAACQPKILAHDDKFLFEYAGAAGGFIDKYGYPFCRGRIFNQLERDTDQYNDNREVFWATGACMFIRAEAFHAAGGLDEDYFAPFVIICFTNNIRM